MAVPRGMNPYTGQPRSTHISEYYHSTEAPEPVYATLHFYYGDDDSMRRFRLCNEAEDVRLAIWVFNQWLWDEIKYEDDDSVRREILEEVRTQLLNVFEERGLDIHEE